jgi:hypothetical protein
LALLTSDADGRSLEVDKFVLAHELGSWLKKWSRFRSLGGDRAKP